MGIKDRINKFVDDRIEKVLSDRTVVKATEIVFDENYVMDRNRIFYKSDTEELYRFFKLRIPKNNMVNTNQFYRVASNSQNNLPLLHYPLASIITKTMVNLLFSNRPSINVLNSSHDIDDQTDKLLDDIYSDNNFNELLQNACALASYSGAVAFKPILDNGFSEYPILMIYPKERFDVVKKYDRVTDIIFRDEYKVDKGEYTLFSIYGYGYIRYKLYKTGRGGNKEEVPITELDATKGLHDIEFYSNGGTYKTLLAIYVENKESAKSDYDNLADDFAALDEIYSNMVDFIRKSRIKTYMPESLMNQDLLTGKKYVKNEYDTSYTILYDSNPAGTNVEAKRDIVDVNGSLNGYIQAFNNVLLNALSTAGLSPCSCGYDIAGANSSALALNIRERVSLRTRGEKLNIWSLALKKLSKLVLDLYGAVYDGNSVYVKENDYEFSITFADYESPTFSEKVTTLQGAIDANLMPLSYALRILYPDKTEDEIDLMLSEIEGYIKTPEDKELDNTEEDNSIKEE